MFCPECGSANAENAKYCYQCGSTILFPNSSNARQVTPSAPAPAQKSKTSKTGDFGYELGRLIVLVVFGLLVVGLAIFAINKFLETERNRTQFNPSMVNASNAANMANATPAPVAKLFLSDPVEVPARNYQSFTLTFNSDSRFYGDFRASGGSNDIDCYLMDENEFINFSNGNSFSSFYTKKKTTVGKIDLKLPAGTYKLVFDNRQSFMTNKLVKIKFYSEN